MSTDPLDVILDAAQHSGLLSAGQRQQITQDFGDRPSTFVEAARRLVDKKLLTPYQVDLLKQGRAGECVLAGRYHILDKLGQGGMGAVYKARDAKLDRIVAIKVMAQAHVHFADAVNRFQREVKALAKVSHPAIVQAFDADQDGERHFLVMEFVEGSSLAEVLAEKGRIAATLAADYVYQAALGMQHAHERGLVHRDLKPGNLFLTKDRRVKILDLGLARFAQDQIGDTGVTREGMGLGTPDYMAPEQFHDARHADPRSDIYSLGCTLYQLIAGLPPFPGSSLSEKALAHETKTPVPLLEFCPDAPAGLALVAERMLAKRPADRFQTARDVAEALALYVAGSSPSLPPLGATASWQGSQLTINLLRKPWTRSQRRLFLAASSFLLLFILLTFFAWPWLFPSDRPQKNPNPGPVAQDKSWGETKSNDADKKKGLPVVVTIPNGLTIAQDGTGQFKTISEALEKTEPGMTIRVLDDAVYAEVVSITSPSQHKGITLESERQATLEMRQQGGHAVSINGVSGVTVRGFRLRSAATKVTLVWVQGAVPGLLLDRLELEGQGYDGITMLGLDHAADQSPAVVSQCVLHRPLMGINVQGLDLQYRNPTRCARIVIRDNSINTPVTFAINVVGDCHQLQIVGNRIWRGGRLSAMQVAMLEERCEDILIANNTFFECAPAFRLGDNQVKGKNIRLCNNLVLAASQPDMIFLEFADYFKLTGPGKGDLIGQKWQVDHNWRESKKPMGNDLLSQSWIPPGPEDMLRDEIAILSRNPSSPDFLRPAKDSPLATKGAGGVLPAYVGALPPSGQKAWDWSITWRKWIGASGAAGGK